MAQSTGNSRTPRDGRRHVEGKPNFPVFAGKLRHELESHALGRAEHFFVYLVTMKILVAELNALGATWASSRFVRVKASDQIDGGMRIKPSANTQANSVAPYAVFDPTDATIVDMPTAQFTRMDAAHWCNLGLAPEMAEACKDSPFARDCYEALKVIAGGTKLLPQRVNIGPDRVIDDLHGELAQRFLDDTGRVLSVPRVDTYRVRATSAITNYRNGMLRDGQAGVAACADCYLRVYAGSDFVHTVYRRVYPTIIARCAQSVCFKGKAHEFYR